MLSTHSESRALRYRNWIMRLAIVGCAALPWQTDRLLGEEPAKITFDDHIKPIFREHCSSCHNNNAKKGGLSLETFQMTMTGGSSGEVLVAGDLDSSRLYALTAHKEQPIMPPMQDRISQAKLDLLKTWIEQGMPENSGSAIRKPTANAAVLSVAATGRPEGPPPMPVSVLRQTPLYTSKASAVSALAASPWSPLIAVGGQLQVSLYHAHNGQLLGIIPFPEGEPQSITFSRDGRLILIGGGRHSSSGFAVLHDIATGNRIAKVGDELDIVLAADISDNNRWIALAGPQKLVRVYDTLTGELKWEQKKHTDWIYALRFSPDGLLLATADRAAGLVIWETGTGRLYADLPGHKGEIRSLAWRPDSNAVVSASLDGTLKMWDMNESKLIKSWDAHGGGAAAVAICNDGTMASTGRDQKVKIWDAGGNAVGEMPALVEAGQEIAISVDGTHVAAGDWAGNVRLWTRANPADEKRLAPNPPTLEMAIESGKNRHTELVALATTELTKLEGLKGTLDGYNKQIAEHQAAITMLDSDIQAATSASSQIQQAIDQLMASNAAAQSDLAKIDQDMQSKLAILNQTTAEKKQLESNIAALQSQKGSATDPANSDPANVDLQIADGLKAVLDKATVLMQLTADQNALGSNKAQREKELAELALAINGKSQELASWMAKIQGWNTAKANAVAQIESLSKERDSFMANVAAAQASADLANANVAAAAQWVQVLESDLGRFQNMRTEFANRKLSLEQSIAQAQTEQQAAESSIRETQPKMDEIATSIQSLESQIAELQKQLASVQEQKQGLDSQRTALQQAIDTAASKMLQLQGDLDNLSGQQQLFETAYKTP